MKKITLLFICLLSVLKNSAYVYIGPCGDNTTYTLDTSTGLLSIEGTGAIANYSSDSYNRAPWFSQRSYIKKLKIADGITSIGNYTFRSCTSLTEVTIGSGVTTIGEAAFSACSSLTEATIPNSVTSIGDGAFSACFSLTEVTIPNSVTSIRDYAFSSCSGLTSISIPNSITSIGNYLFKDCSGLTSVIIPNSVTKIGAGAFSGCADLTSVTIPNGVKSIVDHTFSGCSSLTEIIIPNTITSIGNGGFVGCSGLTSVTIPNSVTEIGDNAFADCSGLVEVIIPNSVSSIGNGAFSGCLGLTSITIPNSVSYIGSRVFSGCSGLTEVIIPNNFTSIGDGFFEGCFGLTSVTIGSKIKQIHSRAFINCSALTDLYCYAEEVPTTAYSVFMDSDIKYASLHVPEVSLVAYQTKSPWNGFGSIVALPIIQEGEHTEGITNFSVDKCTLTRHSIKDKRVSLMECLQILPVRTNGTWSVTYIIDNIIPRKYNIHIVTLPKTLTNETATDLPVKYKIKLQYKGQDSQEVEIDCGAYESTLNEITDNVVKAVEVFGNYLKITLSGNANAKKIKTETSEMYLDYIYLEPATAPLRGDANGDSEIGMPDVMFVVNYILGNPVDTFNKDAADANLDGEIGMPDVMFIVQKILNGKFPDEE